MLPLKQIQHEEILVAVGPMAGGKNKPAAEDKLPQQKNNAPHLRVMRK